MDAASDVSVLAGGGQNRRAWLLLVQVHPPCGGYHNELGRAVEKKQQAEDEAKRFKDQAEKDKDFRNQTLQPQTVGGHKYGTWGSGYQGGMKLCFQPELAVQ